MANEIRTIINSVPKMKVDWKQDWKEDLKVAGAGGIPKNDYGSDNASAPTNSVAPTAPTGTTTNGSTLTAANGTWTGSPTFTYQWLRGSGTTPIGTNTTYVLTAADVGSTIRVRIVGTNAFGRIVVLSPATATVS